MKAWRVAAVILGAIWLSVSPGLAADPCTKGEMQKAVEHAASLLEAKGQAAFPALEKYRFCGQQGYVWVSDYAGTTLLHPISKKLVGANQTTLQDAKGKFFYAEMIAKVKRDGQGWISYSWMNPANNAVEIKCSYVKAITKTIDGKKIWCGAGVYGIGAKDCQ